MNLTNSWWRFSVYRILSDSSKFLLSIYSTLVRESDPPLGLYSLDHDGSWWIHHARIYRVGNYYPLSKLQLHCLLFQCSNLICRYKYAEFCWWILDFSGWILLFPKCRESFLCWYRNWLMSLNKDKLLLWNNFSIVNILLFPLMLLFNIHNG